MIERVALGRVPAKHHIAFRDAEGRLLWEECLTREGFDGPYSILYHLDRPHGQAAAKAEHGFELPVAAPPQALHKRLYRTAGL
jgi:homogentisate 1,2-dioxygenase